MATSPLEGVVRNLVALQRLGTGVSREANALLIALFQDIAAQIARIDPGEPSTRAARLERLDRLMSEVEGMADDRFKAVLEQIRARLQPIGVQQGHWAEQQLTTSLGPAAETVGVAVQTGAVSPDFIRAIVTDDPFGTEGGPTKVLADWVLKTQKPATLKRVRRQIQVGMASSENLGDIIRRVRGTQGGKRFVGGVLEATTRETEAIVRTATNHVANSAHAAVYRDNSDILSGEEFIATLDSRTTLVCASHDGDIWPVGSSDIARPPLHINCRSLIRPVIDWDGLSIDEPPAGVRPAKQYSATKSGLEEKTPKQVSARTDYESWFRDQPDAVQNEIIGPARARLFRDGKIDFKEMVTRDGEAVNVADLPGGKDALAAVRKAQSSTDE